VTRRRTTPPSASRCVVAVAAAALLLTACNRGTSNGPADVTDRTTTTSTTADDDDTTDGTTTSTPGEPVDVDAPWSPDKAKFCDASTVLITVPDDQTPQQYESAVATATASMVASVPDQSLVPLMRQMRQAYSLFAKVASAEAADDPDGAARAVTEAESVFPPADQERFAQYVERECGVDIGF
jgi:hypothetical protein